MYTNHFEETTNLILVVFDFVEMSKDNLRCVFRVLLNVVAGSHDINALHPPPILKSFAVIETRVHALSTFIAIDFPIGFLRYIDLQGVSCDGKVSLDVIERASVVACLHVVPIRTLLFFGSTDLSAIALQVDRRLFMHTAGVMVSTLWTPLAVALRCHVKVGKRVGLWKAGLQVC
jgi:hypothetical protein